MRLLLDRKYKKPGYSIGKLYINGFYFCDTLEDKDRGLKQSMELKELKKLKVAKETAIPTGSYVLIISYSKKFKRDLIAVIDVPAYSGIRIHSGNTAKDTEGCILVGKNKEVGKVINSRYYYENLHLMVKDALERGEKVTLDII